MWCGAWILQSPQRSPAQATYRSRRNRVVYLCWSRKEAQEESYEGDIIVEVELERGPDGLGLDVDHYRKGATIGFISPGGVAAKDGRMRVGDMIRGVNGVQCSTYDEVINAIRASPATVKLTLSRKHVSKLLESRLHMELGASYQRTWEEFTFRLYSNRVLTFDKTQPPVVTGEIDVRLALEVRMVDAPNGGGFLEIETSSKTYVLRSNDSEDAPLVAARAVRAAALPARH